MRKAKSGGTLNLIFKTYYGVINFNLMSNNLGNIKAYLLGKTGVEKKSLTRFGK